MNLRFPLSAKILLWFFLNLVILALGFYVFVRAQFRLGLDSLLTGAAGDRIQSAAEVVQFELNKTPQKDWGNVLKNLNEAYHVKFMVFHINGKQWAGDDIKLPPEVAERFVRLNGPQQGRDRPPREGNRPRFRDQREPEGGFPPDDPLGLGAEGEPPPGLRDGRRGQPGPPRPEAAGGGPARFMLHTPHPSLYWVGVRIGLVDDGRPIPIPAVVLAVSDSISGGGLFVDFVPWLVLAFGAIVISVLLWLPLVRGITRSISQMTRATEQIAEGRFETRMEENRRDELGRLSLAINQMASRLAGFVSGQKRFLGDIAHELCTPIARTQMALGILEQRAEGKQRAYVEDLREEVQQMSSLVNELLSFSKASLEPASIKLQPVNLLHVVEHAVQREGDSKAKICVDVPSDLEVLADPDLLQRSLANLIRNAIRYAGSDGPIAISAGREMERIDVSIADCGKGVPEESLAKLFDPFYRTEAARTRETGGVGLGLAIVKTCIESCQGSVRCRNREPSGLEVHIILQSA